MKKIHRKFITCIFLGACLSFATDEQNCSPFINGKSAESHNEESRITNEKEWDLRTKQFLQEEGLIEELSKRMIDELKPQVSEFGILGVRDKKLYKRLAKASIREQRLERDLQAYQSYLAAKESIGMKADDREKEDLLRISKSKREANNLGLGEHP